MYPLPFRPRIHRFTTGTARRLVTAEHVAVSHGEHSTCYTPVWTITGVILNNTNDTINGNCYDTRADAEYTVGYTYRCYTQTGSNTAVPRFVWPLYANDEKIILYAVLVGLSALLVLIHTRCLLSYCLPARIAQREEGEALFVVVVTAPPGQ